MITTLNALALCNETIHGIILSDWLEQNHTILQPRGPQITPELEMRNIAFFQTACLSEEAGRAFSSKAKLWSLWSVGHVAEEMLIMWLRAGLVCCDLEGSSHGAQRNERSDHRNRPGEGKKVTQTVHFLSQLLTWPIQTLCQCHKILMHVKLCLRLS